MSWKYEYDSDLDNENKIIARIEKLWNCGSAKMEGWSYADFILTRGKIDGIDQGAAFCEIRVRSTPRGSFPTVFITLNKYRNMLGMTEFTGLKSFFVVQWSDECAYLELTEDNEGTGFPKRNKPKGEDHYDEPCILLDVSKFKTLWRGVA